MPRLRTARLAAGLLATALLTTVACGAEEPRAGPDGAPSTTSAEPDRSDGPDGTAEPSPSDEPPASTEPDADLPAVPDRTSLPALMREEQRGELDGSRLRVGEVLETTDAYTRSVVTYESRGLRVSGVLLRPRGPGPFPGVVLNHGYIEPSVYTPGQGMAREQDYLARAGYAVLHTDYRGHASGEEGVSQLDRESRLGYTRDAITAVRSLAREPYVDAERLGMVGRSMGGGVTMNALVVAPGLVDAAVLYASVSSRFTDNLDQFTEPGRPEAADDLYDYFGGDPDAEPEAYAALSPRTYFDRITEPVLSLHGDVDDTCPPRWADATQRLMAGAGVDAQLETYAGEGHTFYARWADSIERTDAFLTRRMGR